MLRIPFDEAVSLLRRALESRRVQPEKAHLVAREMVRNSLEGTYSHGINRFIRLLNAIDNGLVQVDAMPEKISGFGAIENYDGHLGIGVVNADFAMQRAIELARAHGLGLVALRNTNHWQRAATYALQACDQGMAAVCFCNTMPNMPAWGATDARLGNNPLTMAFPSEGGHVVMDMAMSQFSYGAMELAQLQGRQMPLDAGFDQQGNLSKDPEQVLSTMRVLPTGYWKGAALSLLLDLFAAGLSLGQSVAMIGRQQGDEHGVSQVFIAIDYRRIAPQDATQAMVDDTIEALLHSTPDGTGTRIAYPGQRRLSVREENLRDGIPVDESVWQKIHQMVDGPA